MLDPIDVRYFKLAVGSNTKYENQNDICVRCPICGDSKHSKTKARLHLYSKGKFTLVNCFNECSVRNKTLYKFLKEYYPNLLENYKLEKFKGNIEQIKLSENDGIGDFEIPKDSNVPNVLFDLNFFKKTDKPYQYLESRGLQWSPVFGEFFEGINVSIDSKSFPIQGYIVIPFYYGKKCYGFYSRSMSEHKFYTYMPDGNVDFKLWNFYNIDKSKPVYVFEGIFDAMSVYQTGITNVVACCGATPPESLLKDLDCIMCFDNDRTGLKNSLKYCLKGYKVLVYPDSVQEKDFNEMLLKKQNIHDIILNNVYNGILGQVKISAKL